MAINLAPWKYRHLLGDNNFLDRPDFYQIKMLNGQEVFESNIRLKDNLRPAWLEKSNLYKDADGSGTDNFKNIAVYKAISEALERFAFYQAIDLNPKEYAFDLNPTTTGLAAYPGLTYKTVRINALVEASERWSIHSFNRSILPIKKHQTNIKNLTWYELTNPLNEIKVSIISYRANNFNCYGFAGGLSLKQSFDKAIVEVDRNFRILNKSYKLNSENFLVNSFSSATDRTIAYYATDEGYKNFELLINQCPTKVKKAQARVLCDKPLKGEWDQYTKVWRYVFENSYVNKSDNFKFFMF